MKAKIIILTGIILATGLSMQAQRVSVRLDFPVGIHMRATNPAPYRGAVWVGPEWRWDRGRYVAVPGYWARPQRHRAYWVQGHWQYFRHGYRWVPGHWR